MRLSTKGRYAVRSMVDLALHADDGPVTREEIATRQDISADYLARLFTRLVKSGLISSMKGPGGGYMLAQSTATITAGDIIRAVQEPLAPVYCVNSAAGRACDRAGGCVTHLLWEQLGERFPAGYAKWNLVADYWYATGVCCRVTGDYVGALGYYEGILRYYPSYQYAWSAEYLRAGCIEGLMRQGVMPAAEGYAEIEKCYERIVKEYAGCGSYRDALRNLALLNFRRKDWADAGKYLEQYQYEYGGEDPPFWLLFKLGRVYDELKIKELAVYYYARCLACSGGDAASVKYAKARLAKLGGAGR